MDFVLGGYGGGRGRFCDAYSPGSGEHARGLVAQGRVGSVGVVVLAPVFDDDGGFGEAAELFDVEQFVAQAAVEGLHEWVLPGRAGLDERRPRPSEATPVSERVRGQLRSVVTAHVRGRAALVGEALEHGHGLVGVDAAGDVDRERLAGELVNDVEQLDHAAVGGLIELEVQRPDLIGPLRPQPVGRDRRLAEALALAPASGDPEAFFAPETLDALAVDVVAELAEADVRAAVAPARPRGRDLAQQRPQPLLGFDGVGPVALGKAVLPGDAARPALADPEAVLEHQDRAAPTGWAHQFPRLISFSACVSSA